MSSREPLLDTDWLLGSPDKGELRWRRFLYQSGLVLMIVLVGVALWPTLSKAWVQNQLAEQYQNGNSIDSRKAALAALTEMLPESLPVVIAGLSNPVSTEAQLAFEALDYFVGQLTTLSVEHRRGTFAELIHALEETAPRLNEESAKFAMALAAKVSAIQRTDQHPGSVMTLAACQRIMAHQRTSTASPVATRAKLSDTIDSPANDQTTPLISTTASLSDVISEPEREVRTLQPMPQQVAPQILPQAVASVDQPNTPVRMSLKSNEETEVKPLPIDDASATQASANSGQLRQKLLRANRFIPVSGSISVPLQSEHTNQMGISDSPAANEPTVTASEPHQTTTRVVSSREEVIGIGRWKTEDLLTLLSSVTPRLASAAFHELQSRLSPQQLELAVELAQGSPEQRIAAMERLVRDSQLDPLPWLSWMGSEADREVRFKAVSLLGSINNDDSRLRLRMLHGRERDAEISRHIQSALLASGSIKPLIR